jgi:hypothetical protein
VKGHAVPEAAGSREEKAVSRKDAKTAKKNLAFFLAFLAALREIILPARGAIAP